MQAVACSFQSLAIVSPDRHAWPRITLRGSHAKIIRSSAWLPLVPLDSHPETAKYKAKSGMASTPASAKHPCLLGGRVQNRNLRTPLGSVVQLSLKLSSRDRPLICGKPESRATNLCPLRPQCMQQHAATRARPPSPSLWLPFHGHACVYAHAQACIAHTR